MIELVCLRLTRAVSVDSMAFTMYTGALSYSF